MAKDLAKYRAKRKFGETPEPAGGEEQAGGGDGRFVVQEHDASHLHWDLRLEHEGVAASWALPKGIPAHPDENRLAVHTEDHPLEYLEFQGEIPEGSYGAGTMSIWDRGTYEAEKFRSDEVILTFSGERVEGRYALFQTKGKNWMIHRMDPPADPERVPMPTGKIKPMAACLAELPREEGGWAFELKWDGIRAIAYCDHGHITLESRNLRDVTSQYPEIRPMAHQLGSLQAIIDGEVVAFDEEGRPDFQRLQQRMHLGSSAAVHRKASEAPVTYVAFDLLHLEGHELLGLPYADRRKLLADLELDGPSWQTPTYREGDGAALIELTKSRGLEGIVAKRLDSTYQPGKRSRAWLKVKNTHSQELVVGGWLPGEGRRTRTIGALAVGYYDDEGEGLRYAGRVGTGFTDTTLRQLSALLTKERREDSPFEGRQPPKETIFTEPRYVAEVEFREWTKAGTLRAPSFKGLRDDRDPAEVRRVEPG